MISSGVITIFFHGKTQWHMNLSIFMLVPFRRHQHCVCIQSSINIPYAFIWKSCAQKLHWPAFWWEGLHLYLPLSPRFLTLFVLYFQLLHVFLIPWQHTLIENQQFIIIDKKQKWTTTWCYRQSGLTFFKIYFSRDYM